MHPDTPTTPDAPSQHRRPGDRGPVLLVEVRHRAQAQQPLLRTAEGVRQVLELAHEHEHIVARLRHLGARACQRQLLRTPGCSFGVPGTWSTTLSFLRALPNSFLDFPVSTSCAMKYEVPVAKA